MKKKISLLLITCLLIGVFTGCRSSSPMSKVGFYFDTVITITVYEGPSSIIDDCFELCKQYDDILNKNKEGSDVYKINHSKINEEVIISDETKEILDFGEKYYIESNGEFSIYCGAITKLWDYQNENPTVPSESDIQLALSSINKDSLIVSNNVVVRKDDDVLIDVGGIAKGYIADKLKDYIISKGVNRAVINLGGNIVTIGDKDSFNIGIQKPFSKDGEVITAVSTLNKSVVTSGTYQRYFTDNNGKIYHHIIDLNTGYPCDNDLNSVSIICDNSIDADALSTIVFLKGLDNGMSYVESLEGVDAIFIDKENNIYKTSGI